MITIYRPAAVLATLLLAGKVLASEPAYFTKYPSMKMSRNNGVLLVEMTSNGGPLRFSAKEHESYPDDLL